MHEKRGNSTDSDFGIIYLGHVCLGKAKAKSKIKIRATNSFQSALNSALAICRLRDAFNFASARYNNIARRPVLAIYLFFSTFFPTFWHSDSTCHWAGSETTNYANAMRMAPGRDKHEWRRRPRPPFHRSTPPFLAVRSCWNICACFSVSLEFLASLSFS